MSPRPSEAGRLRPRAGLLALAALAAGATWSLPFSTAGAPWLSWLLLAPLFLLMAARRGAFWLGWLHGVAYWLVSIAWIIPTLVTYGGLPRPLSAFLLLLLAAYLGLYHALFAALGGRLFRGSWGLALCALPALWVVLELVRGSLFGGFPWNLAAYAWTEVPGALPTAAWVGAWGVSYLVLFANAGVALALRRRGWRARTAALALGLLVPLSVLALGARFSRPAAPSSAGLEAVALQPNLGIQSASGADVWQGYRKVIERSESLCRERPALLLWPESAVWPLTWERSPRLRQDLLRLAAMGCPVVLNTVSGEPPEIFNSAILVGPEGIAGRYDKRKLVPWGEHVPLARVLPMVGKLARNAGDFSPGRSLGLLPFEGELVAMAICYEVIFPAAVAEQVRAGAGVLATITNDAWYGPTAAPWQHFRAARFRAAESRRALVRSALTGVSAIVDARGGVVAQLGVGEEGELRRRLPGRSELSPFTRAPWAVPSASLGVAVFAIVRVWRRKNDGFE